MITNEYTGNGEWDLIASLTENKLLKYENKDVHFPYVRYGMSVKFPKSNFSLIWIYKDQIS